MLLITLYSVVVNRCFSRLLKTVDLIVYFIVVVVVYIGNVVVVALLVFTEDIMFSFGQ